VPFAQRLEGVGQFGTVLLGEPGHKAHVSKVHSVHRGLTSTGNAAAIVGLSVQVRNR
jgi:hypothetical protein